MRGGWTNSSRKGLQCFRGHRALVCLRLCTLSYPAENRSSKPNLQTTNCPIKGKHQKPPSVRHGQQQHQTRGAKFDQGLSPPVLPPTYSYTWPILTWLCFPHSSHLIPVNIFIKSWFLGPLLPPPGWYARAPSVKNLLVYCLLPRLACSLLLLRVAC